MTVLSSPEHFTLLERSYCEVGDRTWKTVDFVPANLQVSRDLYEPESLEQRRPRPKKLEVFALLSGLSFDTEFTSALVEVQRQISTVLGHHLHYWVTPANLGLEYCVFKWPTGPWKPEWLGVVQDILPSIAPNAWRFTIGGIQINPDGCVVAKGFDANAVMLRIRESLKTKVSFLPEKQSGWAHVPLGRILEPIGTDRFQKLALLIQELSAMQIATTEISSMKLIHETRWYMEERTTVVEYPLTRAGVRANR